MSPAVPSAPAERPLLLLAGQREAALAPLPRARVALAVLVAVAGVLGSGSALWVAGLTEAAPNRVVPREFLLGWPLLVQYALMALYAAAPSGPGRRERVALGGVGYGVGYAIVCAVLR